MRKAYEMLTPDKFDEISEDISYIGEEDAILYCNGENVYVWNITKVGCSSAGKKLYEVKCCWTSNGESDCTSAIYSSFEKAKKVFDKLVADEKESGVWSDDDGVWDDDAPVEFDEGEDSCSYVRWEPGAYSEKHTEIVLQPKELDAESLT